MNGPTAWSPTLAGIEPQRPTGLAAQGAERALRLASAVWAAAWIMLLGSTLATAPQSVRNFPVAVVCLVLTAVAWAALAFRASTRAFPTVAGFALSALVNVVNMDARQLGQHAILETTWLNITAILSAFLLPRRAARAALGALIAGTLLLQTTALLAAGALHSEWRMMLLACVYATCLGLAGVEAAQALRSAAAAADDDAEARGIRAQSDARATAHREAVERVSRLLHDTFVNTLGAIRRGIEADMLPALRDRCSRDVAQLDELIPAVGEVAGMRGSALAHALAEEARVIGLVVHIESEIARDDEIPLDVWQALLGAVREGLTNVAKHAGTGQATIALTLEERRLHVRLRDHGRGWSGQVPPGGGLQRSILQRVQESGGTVALSTEPGGGTVLEYAWELQARPGHMSVPPSRVRHEPPPLDTVARRTSSWLVLLSCAETLLFLGRIPLLGSLGALLLMACMLLLSLHMGRRQLPAWLVLLFIPALAAVVALPGSGSGRCTASDPAAWGVDGAAALILALSLVGPRGWSALAGALGIASGLLVPPIFDAHPASCLASGLLLLPVELGTIFAISMFRRIVERLSAEAAANNAAATALHVQAAAQAAREHAWRVRLHSVSSAIGPLLKGIAAGEVDPGADATRSRAGNAETTLRSLLRIDTQLGDLGDLLASTVVQGLERERVVEVRNAGAVPAPTAGQLAQLEQLLAVAVACTGRQSTLQISLLPQGSGATLTAIVPTRAEVLDPDLRGDLEASQLLVEQVVMESEQLISVTWT